MITPRIKKPGLDRDDVSNYRPISNLTFMSKVMEKFVVKQLIAYLASNNFMPRLQSGFRSGHSTETAILRVLSDGQGQVALLALLDVSAAFDTVDHDILLERLSKSFGNNWVGTPLDQILPHIAKRDCTCGHIYFYINRGACPLWRPTGLRPRTSPMCSVHSRCCRDRDVLRPGRSSLCGWYTAPRQLPGFGCGSIIAIGSPFHWGSSSVDGVKQASTKSGQNSVHLVWYETTTCEAELWSTVICVANSSVWHTRPEPRGDPGQWAADGGTSGSPISSSLSRVTPRFRTCCEMYISQLCRYRFFQLCRLRAIRHSLTQKSILMLARFICNRIDYWYSVLYGASRFQPQFYIYVVSLDQLQSLIEQHAQNNPLRNFIANPETKTKMASNFWINSKQNTPTIRELLPR